MWTPDPSQIITAEQKQAEADAAARLSEFPNLYPDQFWFLLRASGYEQDVRAWIESLRNVDPLAWAEASAKIEFATFFERDHPLIAAFMASSDMTETELDTLWKFATV